jgi:hypothetical protein
LPNRLAERRNKIARVIMIVEDEFSLQLDSAETIEHAGFEVLSGLKIARSVFRPARRPIFFLLEPR